MQRERHVRNGRAHVQPLQLRLLGATLGAAAAAQRHPLTYDIFEDASTAAYAVPRLRREAAEEAVAERAFKLTADVHLQCRRFGAFARVAIRVSLLAATASGVWAPFGEVAHAQRDRREHVHAWQHAFQLAPRSVRIRAPEQRQSRHGDNGLRGSGGSLRVAGQPNDRRRRAACE